LFCEVSIRKLCWMYILWRHKKPKLGTRSWDKKLLFELFFECKKVASTHRGQISAASEYIKTNLLPFIFVRHFVFGVYGTALFWKSRARAQHFAYKRALWFRYIFYFRKRSCQQTVRWAKRAKLDKILYCEKGWNYYINAWINYSAIIWNFVRQ